MPRAIWLACLALAVLSAVVAYRHMHQTGFSPKARDYTDCVRASGLSLENLPRDPRVGADPFSACMDAKGYFWAPEGTHRTTCFWRFSSTENKHRAHWPDCWVRNRYVGANAL